MKPLPYPDAAEALRRLDQLGHQRVTVSIVCGTRGDDGFGWSVDVLNEFSMENFKMPYAAESFGHAVWIAETECKARGWTP